MTTRSFAAAGFPLLLLPLTACIAAPVVGTSTSTTLGDCAEVGLECAETQTPPTPVNVSETRFASPARECGTIAQLTLTASDFSQLPDLRCADVSIDLGSGDAVEVESPYWVAVHVTLTSATARTLVLRRASISDTTIEISGGAWLDVRDSSTMTHVVARGQSDAIGDFLRLDTAILRDLAVTTGPRGHVQLARVSFESGALDVGALTVEESELRGLDIRADAVLLAGTTIRQSAIEAARLSDVAGTWQHISTSGTETLTLFETGVAESNFAASRVSTTFEHANVATSTLRGDLRFSHSNVSDSVVAAGDAGVVTTFNTNIADSKFCDTMSLHTSQGSILCSACDVALSETSLLGTVIDSPECPVLSDMPRPPV